jgi:hypothetical protein
MLGLRQALLAARTEGKDRDRHAAIARDHLRIAASRYTDGAPQVTERVENLRRWVREATSIDLVL